MLLASTMTSINITDGLHGKVKIQMMQMTIAQSQLIISNSMASGTHRYNISISGLHILDSAMRAQAPLTIQQRVEECFELGSVQSSSETFVTSRATHCTIIGCHTLSFEVLIYISGMLITLKLTTCEPHLIMGSFSSNIFE